MKKNKKETIENARKALQMATNRIISNHHLSIDDVIPIADKYFEVLQKSAHDFCTIHQKPLK